MAAKVAPQGPPGFPEPVVALEILRASVLLDREADMLLARSGRYLAVVRLIGNNITLLPEMQEAEALALLERYLERYDDPLMRISSGYDQPLEPYLDFLRAQAAALAPEAPLHAARLKGIAEAAGEAAARCQAQLFADYLVLAYTPPGLVGRGAGDGRGQAARVGLAWLRQPKRLSAAREELTRRIRALQTTLERAGLGLRRVEGDELEALIESAWGTAFGVLPAEDEETPPEGVAFSRRWARTPYGYVRSYLVRDVGEVLGPDSLTSLMKGPGRRLLQFWQQMPQHQAKRVLKFNRTIQATSRHLRSRRDVADLDALRAEQQVEAERVALSYQGTHLYHWRAILQQWAPTLEELEDRCSTLLLELETSGTLVLVPAVFQQEAALLSGLPMATCLARGPERNLNAACLARLAWPGPRDSLIPRGIWLGVAQPAQQLLTLDPLDLPNPVIELVGMMGSGKSMTQKWIVTQLILQGYPAYLVNSARLPNGRGEYQDLVEALGGVVLRLGRTGGVRFNPLQFVLTNDSNDDPFLSGQSQLLEWLEALFHTPLTSLEQVVAGRAYLRALQAAGILLEEPVTWERSAPQLDAFYHALQAEPGEPEIEGEDRKLARLLAYRLRPVLDGPAASLFSGGEQVALGDTQVVCFDLAEVPDNLRSACFQQVLTLIQRLTARQAATRGSVVLLDESHLLLEDERSARRLARLVRDSRKQGRLLLYTTHTSADSQENRAAQLAHATAEATMIFRIKPQNEETPDNLHLSKWEKELVSRQGRPDGECLLLTPTGHTLLQVLIPPAWYPYFTTRPEEVRQLESEGHSIEALPLAAQTLLEEGLETAVHQMRAGGVVQAIPSEEDVLGSRGGRLRPTWPARPESREAGVFHAGPSFRKRRLANA
jgi:hypothetical protein